MLTARRNSAQGLLSTTYILDLEYRVVGDGGEAEQKSLFVKVTLHDIYIYTGSIYII